MVTMHETLTKVKHDVEAILEEWQKSSFLKEGHVFVIGCSTSEVAGEQIGSSGSEDIAEVLFNAFADFQERTQVHVAYQCCEHLNRALVIDKNIAEKFLFEEVSVIPTPDAGGSMVSYAYKHMENPVVVEAIQAHAGMDIGDTMIGMHLQNVAVPLRMKQRTIANAHVTHAGTRPKLIGGSRAKYR